MTGGSKEKYNFTFNCNLENAGNAIFFCRVFLMATSFVSTTLNNNFNQQNSLAY